ncbi:MAG: trypsin-like peptidase domain-containing protein [Cyclobacteriaceae bacterium]|nr:trypsin-like peptidase domain-containing protein [Cyclobacteriaceae bacterium]
MISVSFVLIVIIAAIMFNHYNSLEYKIRKAEKSIFKIHSFKNGLLKVQGTGFFIDIYNHTESDSYQGRIAGIINLHTIDGCDSLVIKTFNDKQFTVEELDYYYDSADILTFSFKKEFFEQNDLSYFKYSEPNVSKGDFVFSIGHPKGLDYSFTEGSISSIREAHNFDIFQTTAPISPGSSGSPLITRTGRIVGIISSTLISGQNLNFGTILNSKSILKMRKLHLSPGSFAFLRNSNGSDFDFVENPIGWFQANLLETDPLFDERVLNDTRYITALNEMHEDLGISQDLSFRLKSAKQQLQEFIKNNDYSTSQEVRNKTRNLLRNYNKIRDTVDSILRLNVETVYLKNVTSVNEWKHLIALNVFSNMEYMVDANLRFPDNPFIKMKLSLNFLEEFNIDQYLSTLIEVDAAYSKWVYSISNKYERSPVITSHLCYAYFLDYMFNNNVESFSRYKTLLKQIGETGNNLSGLTGGMFLRLLYLSDPVERCYLLDSAWRNEVSATEHGLKNILGLKSTCNYWENGIRKYTTF